MFLVDMLSSLKENVVNLGGDGFNPNQAGGGQICPTDFQTLIPLEPNVGFTPNQAVNSSLSVV